MIRKLVDLELRGKTVFLRVDFNVPIFGDKVTEPHRIDSALPTIRLILAKAKKIVIASHLGRPDGQVMSQYSLAPVRKHRYAMPDGRSPRRPPPRLQRPREGNRTRSGA